MISSGLPQRRFTPTGVGTIASHADAPPTNAVHPHGRGDNFGCSRAASAQSGSPPRAWGQWRVDEIVHVDLRFTPTGVGTIGVMANACPHWSVHPHGRGDNLRSLWRAQRRNGSPPRAWGQSERRAPAQAAERFTPTGVGTITCTTHCPAVPAVHPHGRGDNIPLRLCRLFPLGSPPRAWGQFHLGCQAALEKRFTPTGVGTILSMTMP